MKADMFFHLDGPCLVDEALRAKLVKAKKKIAFAESITGGLLGAALTQQSGSSAYFAGSAVCYCDKAKTRVLGVDKTILEKKGAVSHACAAAMAQGALELYGCDIALSVTGFADPANKDAGKVYIGWALKGADAMAKSFKFSGTRAHVRLCAAQAVLEKLKLLV